MQGECPIHAEMDRRAPGLRTVRCSHFGRGRVQERMNVKTGVRWLSRLPPKPGLRPELIMLDPADDPARVEALWHEMEERMRADGTGEE